MAESKGKVVTAPRNTGELSTQDKPKVAPVEESVPESYVWLADGSVVRVRNEDVPQAGHQTLGHWQRGDKVYLVVAVYPVEEKGMVDDDE